MALAQSESRGEAFYQHLPADSIRVLQLKGTSLVGEPTSLLSDLAIDCDMKVIRLSDEGREQYSALSYVWGSPRFFRWLRCDHVLIKITPNLYDALWHLLLSGSGPSLLWVDAMCINQTDNEEKSQQVSMMGQIYQEAIDVIVWLGTIPQNNFLVETFWDKLALQFRHYETSDEPDKVTLTKALKILANNDWFYRVWTLQEISLARKAYVWCGRFCVDWKRFASVAVLLQRRSLGASSALKRLLDTLKSIEFCRSTPDHISLYGLIHTTTAREATDAHDKIFGLLGLWKYRSRLTPAYDEPIIRTRARTVFHIWKAERWLWLNLREIPYLIEAEREEPVTLRKILYVPPFTSPTSWILRLDDTNATVPFRGGTDGHNNDTAAWSFQGPSVPQRNFECLNPSYHGKFQLAGTILRARGVILGTWSRYNAPGFYR